MSALGAEECLCPNRGGDSWRCAKAQHLVGQITCRCPCHRGRPGDMIAGKSPFVPCEPKGAPTKREIFLELLNDWAELSREEPGTAFRPQKVALVDSQRELLVREYDAAPEGRSE